jgi:hypothetical protein
MGATGFQRTLKESTVGEFFKYAIPGQCGLAASTLRHHCHLDPLHGMATDRRINPTILLDGSRRQGQILSSDGARLKLAHQIGLCLQCFGDDQQAAGVLVQAMHNTSAWNLIIGRQMMQQRIKQGAAPVTATRMHNKPGRLVDYDQCFVFKDNIERDIFRLLGQHTGVCRLGNDQFFATHQLMLGFALKYTITVTRPSRTQPCRRLRECCGNTRRVSDRDGDRRNYQEPSGDVAQFGYNRRSFP